MRESVTSWSKAIFLEKLLFDDFSKEGGKLRDLCSALLKSLRPRVTCAFLLFSYRRCP